MPMKKLFISFFIFMTVMVGNSVFAESTDKCIARDDNTYRKMLVGTWIGTEEASFMGRVHIASVTMYKNGKMKEVIYNKEHPEAIIFTVQSRWKVKNGMSYEYVISRSPKLFDSGKRLIVDKIICIGAKTLKTQAADGAILHFNRVAN
jgi:hypothetical protein